MKGLPHFARGEVVKGFGRGSKELGCPTANFPIEVINHLPEDLQTGIYFGFAKLENDNGLYKMVASLGWNPYYKNTKKSMETHIIHEFGHDFYGKELRVALLGYLRPEKNFGSLEELIQAIHEDIRQAKEKLDQPEYETFKTNEFFK